MQPNNTENPLYQSSKTRQRLWLLLVAALCLTAFLTTHFHFQPKPAALSPLAKRAYAMCQAINGSCDAVSAPSLYNEMLPLPGTSLVNRRLWCVNCQTEGRNLVILFNEKTNRVCCVFGEAKSKLARGKESAAITIPQEAASIALLRLRQLRMIVPKARYTMTAPPSQIRENKAWTIEWTVRHPGDSTPRRLKVVLDRADGFPMQITDQYGLQQFGSL